MSVKRKRRVEPWRHEYALLLERHVAQPSEDLLPETTALGRRLVANGLGPCELAAAHEDIVMQLCEQRPAGCAKTLRAARPLLLALMGACAAAQREQQMLNERLVRRTGRLRQLAGRFRRAERSWGESAGQFKAVFETAEDSIFVKDRSLKYVRVNPAMERLFGQPASQLIGHRDEDFFGADAGAHIRQVDARVLSGETVAEEHTKPVNGIPKTFHVIKVPVRDSTGTISGLCGIARDITDRKRTEEALQTSARQLRLLTDNVGALIADVGSDLRYRFVNRQYEVWHRVPRERIVGMHVRDLLGDANFKAVEPYAHAALAGRQVSYETSVTYAGGKVRWISATYVPYQNADGDPAGFYALLNDVTERRRTEEALHIKDRALASSISAVAIADLEGKLVYVNDSFLRLWGYAHESDVLGTPATRYWQTEELALQVIAALRAGEGQVGEMVAQRKDGSLFDAQFAASAVTDENGQAIYLLSSFMDVTERKRAEHALRESERRSRAILDHSFQFIGLLSPAGVVVQANRSALEFAGIDESDVLGKPFWETPWWVHSSQQQERLRWAIRQAAGGEFTRFEATHPAHDGSLHWVDFSLKPVRNEAGKVSLLVPEGRDITELKQAEAALRASEQQYRDLFENVQIGIYRSTLDGSRFLAVNQELADILGYSREELLTQRPVSIWTDRRARDEMVRRLRQQGALTDYEVAVRTSSGDVRTLLTSIRLYPDRNYLEGTGLDITEHKRADAALAESEQRYRALFEQAPDSIVLVDTQRGALVEFNDRACENLGYTRAEFQNLTVADVEVIESSEEVVAHTRKIVRQGGDTFVTKHRTKTGEIRDVVVTCRAVSIGGQDFSLSTWRDVTERKRMEDALRQFKTISDRATYGVAISDLEGNLTYINDAFAQMHGYASEALVGRHLSVFHAQEQMPHVHALNDLLRREGSYTAREVWHCRRDGRLFPTLMNASVITDETGTPSFLSATAIDITERKQAEAALRESEAKYRQLFATVRDAIIVFDAETLQFVDVNDAALQLYGYSEEQFLNMRHTAVTAEPEQSRDSIAKTLAGKLSRIPLRYHKKKNGTVFPVEISVSTLALAGRPLLCGVVRDITERKLAEQSLHRQALVFENMLEAVIVTDGDQRITDWNPAAARMFGYTREEVLGKTPAILYPPSDRPRLRPQILEAIGRDGHWRGAGGYVAKDGREGRAEATLVALYDEAHNMVGTVAVLHDITERVRAEEEIEHRRLELAHMARLATMGEMATGLAHELNQPLSAILYYARGCGRRLRAGSGDTEEILGVVEKIATQAERAAAFVDHVRAFVRKAQRRLAPIDLNQAVREAAGFVAHEVHENNVAIVFQLRTPLPPVMADMIQIEHVILNVLRNGIEAMQACERDRRKLTVQTSCDGDTVLCAITDTGYGYADEVADRLFDAFFTTKPEGMGMGLAISRSIIEAHGGTIYAAPNPDGGTTFRFTLPVSRDGERRG
jgi:PAS domain S-box-containing protein